MLAMSENHTVDILLAVHNGQHYLAATLDSLCRQTMKAWRMIVIDDASADATPEILQCFAASDSRIEVHRNERQLRLPASLNRGLRLCRAPLIARADADDVYEPERLEKQVAFMKANPDVGLLGSACRHIDSDDKVIGATSHPCSDELIRFSLPFGCAFVHPSVMFRREVVEQAGGYYEELWTGQDYDLWSRMMPITKMRNLPDCLLRYRVHTASITQSPERAKQHDTLKLPIHRRMLEGYLGRNLDEVETRALVQCVSPSRVLDEEEFRQCVDLCTEYLTRCEAKEPEPVISFFRKQLAEGFLAQAGFQPVGSESVARQLFRSASEFDSCSLRTARAFRLWLRLHAPKEIVRRFRRSRENQCAEPS